MAAIDAATPDLVENYLRYWIKIRPKSPLDFYHRWLFAFASIRTTWQMNCRIFIGLKNLPTYFSYDQLAASLEASRSGMYVMRTKAIWEFTQKYWAQPTIWQPYEDEPMTDARKRMLRNLHGIGMAKTSFVFEMNWPRQSEVTCLDTHILQLYGQSGATVTDRKYLAMEKHWCETCRERNLPAPIVRHIYWDRLRGQTNTRYWSHVLHRGVREFQPPTGVAA